ncbi:beta-ketoacyl synthase chain length factor [Shewanella sp. UCD-KL12]|uniref:beta-ketoacyl synthase chain length factor n=1 Tax=Shewanella sp. UCD-KL12 TaxID=1917163 RepID=UPI000970331F|nr:beta-ketoacyl synthase chain length factor [Shewanella sp. UCD-KL12]
MQLTFSICSWGAWSPQYQLNEEWQHWEPSKLSLKSDLPQAPKLMQVPSMKRRRYSALTKMQLEAAFQADAPASCRTIFASRHGELHRTLGLLNNLVEQEPLSPTAFSQSVHNTASGIYSILKDNRSASTSIAAGEESLLQAMIEAYGQLHEDPSPLMLVFADQAVPEVYDQYVDETELPLAMALVLANNNIANAPKLTISQQRGSQALSYGALLNGLSNNMPIAGNLSKYHWELSFA